MARYGTGRTNSPIIKKTRRLRSRQRVAVDEKQIEFDGEKKWLFAASDIDETEFLVDSGSYLTAPFRHELSDQLNYKERNHIEKWFQTVLIRIDRFHTFLRGSQSSSKPRLRCFRHHYNCDRPKQALDGDTPPEVILN
jgi:transposase-like protein